MSNVDHPLDISFYPDDWHPAIPFIYKIKSRTSQSLWAPIWKFDGLQRGLIYECMGRGHDYLTIGSSRQKNFFQSLVNSIILIRCPIPAPRGIPEIIYICVYCVPSSLDSQVRFLDPVLEFFSHTSFSRQSSFFPSQNKCCYNKKVRLIHLYRALHLFFFSFFSLVVEHRVSAVIRKPLMETNIKTFYSFGICQGTNKNKNKRGGGAFLFCLHLHHIYRMAHSW